jgi:lysophospholipase L1-like esterase
MLSMQNILASSIPSRHRRFTVGAIVALLACAIVAPPVVAQSSTIPEKRDGAFYDHFERINKRVRAHQGDVDLVFVGDSITHGWDGPGRAVWNNYYSDRKAQNLGVNGDRTQHVLWRLENGNLEGIQPKVAVLMIGVNNSWGDSAQEIVAGVTAVVNKLQTKVPGIQILLLDILPNGQTFNEKRGMLLQVNQTVRKLHDGKNIIYLPIGHYFLEQDGSISASIMPDYVHPSAAGYEIWASQMETTLASLLGDEPKLPDSSHTASQNPN